MSLLYCQRVSEFAYLSKLSIEFILTYHSQKKFSIFFRNKNVKNLPFTINFFSLILISNILDICLYHYAKSYVPSMRKTEGIFYG